MEKLAQNPSTCSGKAETVQFFLDNELPLPEKEAFEQHLSRCTACQNLLVDRQLLFSQLASLQDVDPPPDLVAQVLLNLGPACYPTRSYGWLGQLTLVGQILVGIALMLLARPAINATVNDQMIRQTWQVLSDLAASLNGWLVDAWGAVGRQLLAQWPPPVTTGFGTTLSPEMALALAAGLLLAWLIGNRILLRINLPSLRNGGAQ